MDDQAAQRIAVLCHHRWAISILAELHRSGGCKFITLVNRLGISRDSLRKTLKALIDAGWVSKNPGYGHPLRPEYLPTRSGARLGRWCVRVSQCLAAMRIERIAWRKWTMPIVYALSFGRLRFSQIRSIWPELTPRALAMALKELQESHVVERLVADAYPPATFYRLTRSGRRLASSMRDPQSTVA